MKKWLFGIIVALVGIVAVEGLQLKKMTDKWKVSEANVKAYSNELSNANTHNTALQLTVDQLEYFNDSILNQLDEVRKELKIKDKNLQSLQYISSGFSKVDTIIITQVDTLFKEPSLAIDTLIGDEWYKLELGLKYPSTIVTKPEFKSAKFIIVSTKKETVNPPKKFFVAKWFQKKHRVLKVNIKENNPYVIDGDSKFVQILK